MHPERQAEIIKEACRAVGIDSHIKRLELKKEAYTWAERIAAQHKESGQTMPVKNSYMYCDTLDMCFFFMGRTPAVSYAGYTTAGSKDITGGISEAFKKADAVLRYMLAASAKETSGPLALEELRQMVLHEGDKPAILWIVFLDEDGNPDYDTGEWEMFDGHSFLADGTIDNIKNYGTKFIAYLCPPKEVTT